MHDAPAYSRRLKDDAYLALYVRPYFGCPPTTTTTTVFAAAVVVGGGVVIVVIVVVVVVVEAGQQ